MKEIFCVFIILALTCLQFGQETGVEGEKDVAKEALVLLPLTAVRRASDGVERLRRSSSVYGLHLKVVHEDVNLKNPKSSWEVPLLRAEVQRLQDNKSAVVLVTPPVFPLKKAVSGDADLEDSDWELARLRAEVQRHKDNHSAVILVVDGYDTVFTAGHEEILTKFLSLEADIVFGAAPDCVPEEFAAQYPASPAEDRKYSYLNSGVMMGYAPSLHRLLSREKVDGEDLQRHFQSLYVDPEVRGGLGIKLDHWATLVQNIDSNEDDVELSFEDGDTRLVNRAFRTKATVVHGFSAAGRVALMGYGNYVAKSWTVAGGCLSCRENRLDLASMKESKYPLVLLGVFFESKTPFFDEMLAKVTALVYPKGRTFLYIYNNVAADEHRLLKWIKRNANGYSSIMFTSSSEKLSVSDARHRALDTCRKIACDAYFHVDSSVHLDNEDTLSLLLAYNRTILTPVMTRRGALWATFWGSVSDNHYYRRSFDYLDIISGNKKGIWNVPYIYGVYVIWRSAMGDAEGPLNYRTFEGKNWDADLAFTINNRHSQTFMYAVNLENYGHLLDTKIDDPDNYTTDLVQISTNPADWEEKYLDPEYQKTKPYAYETVCDGVYKFPVFNSVFCKEMMKLALDYENNKPKADRPETVWTKRLTKVGIKDFIQLDEINYSDEWQTIVEEYINRLEFGSINSTRKSSMNVIAKYNPSDVTPVEFEPTEYTVRIALNPPGTDYEGSGWKFEGKDCPGLKTEVGQAIIYPASILMTHSLQLELTKGTKYELIAFVEE